jgi:hypothetical protein
LPGTKRNLKIKNIYNGSRDGWVKEVFRRNVFNKGPTLIILRSSDGAICGGYTSKNWDGRREFTYDIDAFVFNMKYKYEICDHAKAIYTWSNGFMFGNNILRVSGDVLNKNNRGWCWTG